MSNLLESPHHLPIHYLGPKTDQGTLPAFFYFALSAEESLHLHPYCQPARIATSDALRVFSFTIPGHGEEMNKFHALHYWAERMAQGEYILESFFERVVASIQWLLDQKIVDPEKIAVGGLSRGGFIATHIAAKMNTIRTVLGFAPLTELMQIREFNENPHLHKHAQSLDLIHLVDHLTHVHHVRFYIGNRDTRVGTDACYFFIRRLAEKGHEKRARHQKVELMITHSIGHQGHGTDPHIFEEGSLWLKDCLLREKT